MMSFWDDFFKRVKETTDEAETTLKKEATRRAASAALSSFKKKASDLAEDFVSTAERELEESRAGRPASPEYKPSTSDMDGDVNSLIAEANALEREHREARLRAIRSSGSVSDPGLGEPATPVAPPPKRRTLAEQRQDREDRARKELEAMKARLAGGSTSGNSDGGDDEAEAPPKRTL